MHRRAIVILCAALVAGCSAQAPAGTGPAGGATSAAPGAPSVGDAGGASTPAPGEAGTSGTAIAHVDVASGSLKGTYDEKGFKYDCNKSSTGSGATFLDTKKVKGLSSLQFSAGEGGASPGSFYFVAAFADPSLGLLQQPGLEIATLAGTTKKGHGTANLEDKGATLKWTIDGTTADGIGVKATIECGPVDRR
jgi:hypothetical protein